MKFNKVGRVALVTASALILASLFTACNPVTIDYVYVAGSKANPGQVEVFEIDRVSGAMSQIGSIVSSGGPNPVSLAISLTYHYIYAANQGNNTIVQFNINPDGTLQPGPSVTLASEGLSPVSIITNNAATLLYVVSSLQPGCTTATAGAATCNGGALAVFPLSATGALGAPIANGNLNYWPIGINPTAVAASQDGLHVYATTYDPAAGLGYMYDYNATPAGVLTPVPGSPEYAGVKPSGMIVDPTSRFVYTTDFAQNEIIAYTIESTGLLLPLINGPFKTGNEPSAITIDPRGIYLYVSNELDNTVSAYEITLATGTPTAAVNTSGTQANVTATAPVSLVVDPGFGRYVMTANYLDNSLSAFQINGSTGTLSPGLNGPYPSVALPTSIVSIPRGNHAIQVNQP